MPDEAGPSRPAATSRSFQINKLHPVIGAEVVGVDLRKPVALDIMRQIKQAWFDHTVVVFRDQDLTSDQQREFAGNFGPIGQRLEPPSAAGQDAPKWKDLMLVSNDTDVEGNPIGALGQGEMWFHTDRCYVEKPHRATFLYAVKLPSEGGNTRFSSLCAAYQKLPQDTKRRFDDAVVLQGHQYSAGRRLDLSLPLKDIHHCRQPMVVTNPDSHRKGLYVSSQNTMWIEGMEREESEAMLQQLFEIVEDPAIIYEHEWRYGDLLMWDNLSCLHARTNWPKEQARTLRRCTVIGEKLM